MKNNLYNLVLRYVMTENHTDYQSKNDLKKLETELKLKVNKNSSVSQKGIKHENRFKNRQNTI